MLHNTMSERLDYIVDCKNSTCTSQSKHIFCYRISFNLLIKTCEIILFVQEQEAPSLSAQLL